MSSVSQPKRRPIKGAGMVKAPKKHGAPMNDSLDRLGTAIEQIQKHNASKLSFEEHYRYAYNLVLHKQGHLLYNKVAELISEHLEKETLEKIVPNFPPSTSTALEQTGNASAGANVAAAAAGQLFLDSVRDVWEDHMACMSKLRDVLKYMDKMYTGSIHLPNVWDLGLSLFLHHVLLFSTDPQPKPAPTSSRHTASTSNVRLPTSDPTTVAFHLIRTLLEMIRIEREGEPISRHSVQACTELLCELTDECAVPLPVTASSGTGAGTPVLGVGSGGSSNRSRPVMGEGMPGDQASPYKTSLEKAFLKQSEEFYQKESATLLVECDAPTFLNKINRRLDEEATRAQSYLAPTTEVQLILLLEKVLITANIQAVLEHPSSGLPTLIQDSRIDDLELLYQLFGRVETGRPALQAGLSAWIVSTGKKVNAGLLQVTAVAEEEAEAEAPADSKGKGKAKAGAAGDGSINAKTKAALDWVQSVLDLKDKFDVLLSDAFASDSNIEKGINDAFSVFVNENLKSPEYISLFVDENLKKGLKGKSEGEADIVLDKSIALFRFLNEKDQFERYYNSHLAKRLISNRSVSDDAERNMLAKFKIEAGAAFTKNAEGMMKDMRTSADAVAEYKRFQDRQASELPFEMIATVCGSNNWPFTNNDTVCIFPEVLQKGIESFRAFYNSKHSGRKLNFRPELGQVDVTTRFKNKTHELSVPTNLMIVLALFEGLGDEDNLSYGEISDTTKMAPADLRRTLQSLACAKYKILTKKPKSREVNDSDVFSFNSAFSNPLFKIKIQQVANKVESSDERKETEEKIEEERNTLCDACIVRIMKDRKLLAHTELVNEVIRQVSHRFQPRPQMVKKAIERMIEKEYLERGDDRRMLSYIA